MAKIISMLAPVALKTESPLPDGPHLDFEAVYAEYFDFVWRNLRRLGVPEPSLRDAAQEVFLVVYRRLAEFIPRGTIRSWIYSILRRVAFAQKRQYRSRGPVATFEPDDWMDESHGDPERDVVRNQSLRMLLALLNTLDDDKRDALVSVDIEGMSVPEACMALDVNPNTLYSRLRAARRQMRERLTANEFDVGGICE
jgi:RNA polymerase sigma-70 factor (ECF subfamily)